MMWARLLSDGGIEFAPPILFDEEGYLISNPQHNDYVNMGYKQIIMNRPSYNPITHGLRLHEIKENETHIFVTFVIVEKG